MLSFASATGNLYNRWGKLGLVLSQMRAYQLAQLTNITDTTNGAVAQFDSESDIQAVLGSAYIGILNGAGSVGSTLKTAAVQTLNRMIFRDNPRIYQTLTGSNTLASIQELIRQMKVAGATVRAHTITATPSAFTGAGTGVINVSTTRPQDGLVLENMFAESILFTCNSDSFTGGATAGNEGFLITGTGAQSDVFAFNWPLGSNSITNLNAIDGNSDNSSGNLLVNSGFSDWTDNVPDNWELVVGTAGTNISQETTIVYDGSSSSLKITGDAPGTNIRLRQVFGDDAGTTATLDPLTQYSFNLFIRRDGIAAGQGILTISLAEEDGTVIQDILGNDISFDIDLTTLSTNFASVLGTFRTPLILPDAIYLDWHLTTSLTNGRSVYIDKASTGLYTQFYTAGPYLAVHSGDVDFEAGDYGTVLVTNTRGAVGSLNTFQTLMQRFFLAEMMGTGLLLPSSNVPTIQDSLIG